MLRSSTRMVFALACISTACAHSSPSNHWADGSGVAEPEPYAEEIEASKRRQGLCALSYLNSATAGEICVAREQQMQANLRALQIERERTDMIKHEIARAEAMELEQQAAEQARVEAMELERRAAERARAEEAAQAAAEQAEWAEAQAKWNQDALAEAGTAPPWWCFLGSLRSKAPLGLCHATQKACRAAAKRFDGVKGTTRTSECRQQPLAACVSSQNLMRNEVAWQCHESTDACETMRGVLAADPDETDISPCLRFPTTWLERAAVSD